MAATDPLSEAKRLLGRDPARAFAVARTAHAMRSTPEATLLLATAARRYGDPRRAVALLEPLARAAPRAWGIQHEFGVALASTGDADGGIAALERAAALNPTASGPRHALRDLRALAGTGTFEPAAAALCDPVLKGAVVALTEGREGAGEALLDDFGLDAHDPVAACLIAEVAALAGCGESAVTMLANALQVAPAYGPARFRLAEALHRANRDSEALEALEPLLEGTPATIVRALRGAILMRLGREAEALIELAAVTDADPLRATARIAQGHAHRALGQRDAAIAAYRGALAVEPRLAEAWWSIADLKTGSLDSDDRRAMEILAANGELEPLALSQVDFALGRACEDAGDYDAAFARYRSANSLRRSIEPFDDVVDRLFFDRLMATADAPFFTARAGWGDAAQGPIFIVGMPRSGSTLIEQILASHSRVEGLSELPDITNLARAIPDYPAGLTDLSRADVNAMGGAYLRDVHARQRSIAPHVVDKFPGNAFHTALIHLILPNARIIDVRRNPLDCCVSLYAQSFAEGQSYSYDLIDLGRRYARYTALMRHFDRVLPTRILRVEYEAFVDDVDGQTRRLLDHCGLDFEPATLRFFERRDAIRTASSEQVRQPIYRTSIGRWRRFERWLEPLQEALTTAEI